MKSRRIGPGNGSHALIGSPPRDGDDPLERGPDRQAGPSRMAAIPAAST